jgi:hypothetical protein
MSWWFTGFKKNWEEGKEVHDYFDPEDFNTYILTSNVPLDFNQVEGNLETIRLLCRRFELPSGVWINAHCKGKLRHRVVGLGTAITFEARSIQQ